MKSATAARLLLWPWKRRLPLVSSMPVSHTKSGSAFEISSIMCTGLFWARRSCSMTRTLFSRIALRCWNWSTCCLIACRSLWRFSSAAIRVSRSFSLFDCSHQAPAQSTSAPPAKRASSR